MLNVHLGPWLAGELRTSKPVCDAAVGSGQGRTPVNTSVRVEFESTRARSKSVHSS
jgi:hypothetical protein